MIFFNNWTAFALLYTLGNVVALSRFVNYYLYLVDIRL